MEITAPPAATDEVIVRDPNRCGGAPSVVGTRIGVHDVVSYFGHYRGDLKRVQEEALPHLSLEQLQAAMAWYGEHKDEVDGRLRLRREHYERLLAEQKATK